MKNRMVIIIVVALAAVSFTFPCTSHAWRGHGYPPPSPVYAYPPQQAYAYPDPAYPYGRNMESPPGEWVTVPGHWIDGTWVPSHRAWVPVNP